MRYIKYVVSFAIVLVIVVYLHFDEADPFLLLFVSLNCMVIAYFFGEEKGRDKYIASFKKYVPLKDLQINKIGYFPHTIDVNYKDGKVVDLTHPQQPASPSQENSDESNNTGEVEG